jgi:hypothetical protein
LEAALLYPFLEHCDEELQFKQRQVLEVEVLAVQTFEIPVAYLSEWLTVPKTPL